MNGEARWAGALLAALLLGATRAAPAGGIVVDVTPPRQSLTRSDDVVVTVTIRNTSNAVRYLLTWQTPFGGVQAPLFDVTRDGLSVGYLGVEATRPPPTAHDFIALGPGKARSVRVELSALYRMDITGAYSVRYRADRLRVYTRPDARRPQGAAATAPVVAAVWIDGRLPRGMPEPSPGAAPAGGGVTFSHCSNAQQDSVAASIRAGDAADLPVTVDCACTRPWYAYVYPNEPATIHVCKAFWTAPATGTVSRRSVLLHEMRR